MSDAENFCLDNLVVEMALARVKHMSGAGDLCISSLIFELQVKVLSRQLNAWSSDLSLRYKYKISSYLNI